MLCRLVAMPMVCLHMLLSVLKMKDTLFHLPHVVFESTSQPGQICKCLLNWCHASFWWDVCFMVGRQQAEGCYK